MGAVRRLITEYDLTVRDWGFKKAGADTEPEKVDAGRRVASLTLKVSLDNHSSQGKQDRGGSATSDLFERVTGRVSGDALGGRTERFCGRGEGC